MTLATLALLVLAAAPDGRLLSNEPYAFPPYEKAAGIAEYHGHPEAVSRAEYEAAAKDPSLAFRRLTYASDGLEVVAYAALPAAAAGPRLPVIVFNRGSYLLGDIGHALAPHLRRFAREGFVVVAPMYRESAGAPGRDEVGGADLHDLLNVARLLPALPRADPQRVFLYGESRGGVMALLALRAGFPARAAATVGAFTDLQALLDERPDRYGPLVPRVWPDFARDRAAIVARRSPAVWAAEIPAPVLILHGAKDPAVDAGHALRLAARLHEAKRPFELVVYGGDNHRLTRNAEDRDARVLRFFRQHLGRP